jgi:hypothetical protein
MATKTVALSVPSAGNRCLQISMWVSMDSTKSNLHRNNIFQYWCLLLSEETVQSNYVTQQWKEGPINQEKNYAQGKHPTKNGEFQKSVYNIALVLPLLQDKERKKRACGA